jgi:pimeloyl-ACP methyl ester carboxylesterase
MSAVTHRHVDLTDVRLHLAEARGGGEDAPLVVLLHGFPEHWWSWRHQLEALSAAGLWAVAPDMRGYNASDKPEGVRSYDVERLVDDVAGIIRALGRTRATVVGHDWGGMVAWYFASARPEMLERLAILNCPHPVVIARHIFTPAQLVKSSYIFFFQLPRLPERTIARGDFAAVRRMFAKDGIAREDIERHVEALRTPGALSAALNYYRALGRRRFTFRMPKVRRIDAPVRVIWGDRDPYLGSEMAEPPARLVPEARVIHLPEASHWVQNAAHGEVSRLLVDFVRGG